MQELRCTAPIQCHIPSAVLVAISIPIFNSQLEKARQSTDLANVRSAYAEVVADYLTNNSAESKQVAVTKKASWLSGNGKIADGKSVPDITSGSYVVAVDASGSVTISSAQ